MKQKQTFALRGNLVYTKEIGTMEILEQQYLVCEDGRVQGSIRNSRKSFAAFR